MTFSAAASDSTKGDDRAESQVFEPATLLVAATPSPGKEKQWEQALGELIRASLSFPGHLGTTVLKPTATGDGKYRILTKFDSTQHMESWQDSDERQRRVERITQFQSKPADIHFVSGLETWFELPHHGEAVLRPPPKFKMAVIIWIALYFTVLPLIGVLKPFLSPLPGPLGSAILAVGSVVLMTWIVMPLLTVVFRFWLYPNSTKSIGPNSDHRDQKKTPSAEHEEPALPDRRNSHLGEES